MSAVFADSILFGTRLTVHFPLANLSVKKVDTKDRYSVHIRRAKLGVRLE